MRHRPAAGGMIDHGVVGLLSMVFAVLVGIGGGALSLLLRWPGFEQASPVIRMAAHAHVPLLIFFAALPAALGGLAVAALPGQIGGSRSALPVLDAAALAAMVAALAALIGGACGFGRIGFGASANLLALAAVLVSANLITTILTERRIAYAALPVFAWTTLIASVLALCAAPIMAAVYSIALWRGIAVQSILPGLVGPALCVVLVLVLGLVTDIVSEMVGRRSTYTRAVPVFLGGGMLGFFLTWASCQENQFSLELSSRVIQGLLLLLIAPVLLIWAVMLARAPRQVRSGGLPAWFAAGFALILPVGLISGVIGVAGHEATSLAIMFGVLAGFFRMTAQHDPRPIVSWSAQAQFWLLLGGSSSLLLPAPPVLEALGAAMSSLSIALFVVHLLAALMQSWSASRRATQAPMVEQVATAGGWFS